MVRWAKRLRISIHAPLAGSDGFSAAHNVGKYISIHAPLAGSDFVKRANAFAVIDFNPRSPCGERRPMGEYVFFVNTFQSTLPLRGATQRPVSRHWKP